jgi:hypothetical protein
MFLSFGLFPEKRDNVTPYPAPDDVTKMKGFFA